MKTAVILAGGKGARLRPYTVTMPKPLVPVGEKPILEIVLCQLKKYGFEHIILAVNHQADLIRAYFSDGAKWGVKITYSLEEKPLGTMGPLHLICQKSLPDDFLVMNGDILSDMDYSAFLDRHISCHELLTVSSFQRVQYVDYGVLEICCGALSGFREKPQLPYSVSMGVYALNKEALKYIPKGESFGFDQLVQKLLSENKRIAVKEYGGYWMDIGRPEDYEPAICDVETGKFVW